MNNMKQNYLKNLTETKDEIPKKSREKIQTENCTMGN